MEINSTAFNPGIYNLDVVNNPTWNKVLTPLAIVNNTTAILAGKVVPIESDVTPDMLKYKVPPTLLNGISNESGQTYEPSLRFNFLNGQIGGVIKAFQSDPPLGFTGTFLTNGSGNSLLNTEVDPKIYEAADKIAEEIQNSNNNNKLRSRGGILSQLCDPVTAKNLLVENGVPSEVLSDECISAISNDATEIMENRGIYTREYHYWSCLACRIGFAIVAAIIVSAVIAAVAAAIITSDGAAAMFVGRIVSWVVTKYGTVAAAAVGAGLSGGTGTLVVEVSNELIHLICNSIPDTCK